ncbi:hypothetical protein SD37_10990 [Amycolatopsis orientalis]|uniref:Cation/H+ exchanger transmembrane domain-containing protein n=1 Tax=Amycolatopsis orientalis TaxID=31958 RepID=A0A193BVA4_AMYOR|nr:cation:proton antiporter [Amycolatopsis orientalis]ANN16110.1 hypothetical protein SD37_10990 [Amycolatopsis orientalis]
MEKRRKLWPWLTTCAALAVAAAFGVARFSGRPVAEPPAGPESIPQWRALLAVTLIVVVARLGGTLAARFGQARVLGEVVAGVLLGPSLLGILWPSAQQWLFAPGVGATMETLAQLGVLVFVFLVGTESAVSSRAVPLRPVAAISFCGLAVPFALGVLLAAILPEVSLLGLPEGGNAAFALFIGVSLSVIALPVLARLVSDLGMRGTALGALALRCAAVTDLVCWCLLGVAAALAGHRSPLGVAGSLVLTAAVAVLLLGVVRRGLGRLGDRQADRIPSGVPVGLLGGMLLTAAFTGLIGMHSVLGAFLFGAAVPKDLASKLRLDEKLQPFVSWLLLPLFFCVIGLNVHLDVVVRTPMLAAVLLLVVFFAVLGKWLGAGLTARFSGYSWQQSNLLATLLNCRGLTELVVLDVGRRMGILPDAVFSLFVLMTLVTTVGGSVLAAGYAGPYRIDKEAVRTQLISQTRR